MEFPHFGLVIAFINHYILTNAFWQGFNLPIFLFFMFMYIMSFVLLSLGLVIISSAHRKSFYFLTSMLILYCSFFLHVFFLLSFLFFPFVFFFFLFFIFLLFIFLIVFSVFLNLDRIRISQ